MRRWIAFFLVLILLPWQAAGWASTTLTSDGGADERHALAHWFGEAHHHDADQHSDQDTKPTGMHQDDSEESIQHVVHTDAHLNPMAVLPLSIDWVAVVAESVDIGVYQNQPLAPPFLEEPRRPPRLSC
ncbi:MAG: hypothetical protein H7Y33_11795 [Cytophagales bacterium]|nr:hypothetical protein [Rhizobacter sp.]